ncbi:MerR family transcriptional regulator [Amphritea sp.]|uniref:MerR family transcriptional regulator n=1 Tax=Amphritea sp. TaxID=1872502 RepID=UPI0025C68D81|nr:MerR family transcriptional regulator [Amphritea sp.]
MAKFTISAAARDAGVGVETIRYYQRIGLIPQPPKPAIGYRSYTHEDLQQLRFIQRAKQLGFNLAEIKTLLSLEEMNCDETRQLASCKLDDVTGKIKDLQSIATTLETLIASCESNNGNSTCPIIEAISRDK